LFEVYNKLTFHILITAVQFGITQKCLNYWYYCLFKLQKMAAQNILNTDTKSTSDYMIKQLNCMPLADYNVFCF
jgi:hypothetical protein